MLAPAPPQMARTPSQAARRPSPVRGARKPGARPGPVPDAAGAQAEVMSDASRLNTQSPNGALWKLARALERAQATSRRTQRASDACQAQVAAGVSSLQKLAAVLDDRTLLVRKERDDTIMPLCRQLNQRRRQIVQAMEERKTTRQELGRLIRQKGEEERQHLEKVGAERRTFQDQVAKLEEQLASESLQLRQTSLARQALETEKEQAAHRVRELSATNSVLQGEKARALMDLAKAVEAKNGLDEKLANAQDQLSVTQQAESDRKRVESQLLMAAQEASSDRRRLEAELSEAKTRSDDLQVQLAQALEAKAALSGSVDKMLVRMDFQNKMLDKEMAAVECAKRKVSMPALDQDTSALSISVHREPGQGSTGAEQSSPAGSVGTSEAGESAASGCNTPKTPKAALRKRLLEARNNLGAHSQAKKVFIPSMF